MKFRLAVAAVAVAASSAQTAAPDVEELLEEQQVLLGEEIALLQALHMTEAAEEPEGVTTTPEGDLVVDYDGGAEAEEEAAEPEGATVTVTITEEAEGAEETTEEVEDEAEAVDVAEVAEPPAAVEGTEAEIQDATEEAEGEAEGAEGEAKESETRAAFHGHKDPSDPLYHARKKAMKLKAKAQKHEHEISQAAKASKAHPAEPAASMSHPAEEHGHAHSHAHPSKEEGTTMLFKSSKSGAKSKAKSAKASKAKSKAKSGKAGGMETLHDPMGPGTDGEGAGPAADPDDQGGDASAEAPAEEPAPPAEAPASDQAGPGDAGADAGAAAGPTYSPTEATTVPEARRSDFSAGEAEAVSEVASALTPVPLVRTPDAKPKGGGERDKPRDKIIEEVKQAIITREVPGNEKGPHPKKKEDVEGLKFGEGPATKAAGVTTADANGATSMSGAMAGGGCLLAVSLVGYFLTAW